MTRWHGQTMAIGLRPLARPTARALPGSPDARGDLAVAGGLAVGDRRAARSRRACSKARAAAGRSGEVEVGALAGEVLAQLGDDRLEAGIVGGVAGAEAQARDGAVVVDGQGQRADGGGDGGLHAGHNGRSAPRVRSGCVPSTVHATLSNTCSLHRSTRTAEEPSSMVDLTKRQQEIFDFIKRYSAKYGYPPTVRDIGKAVGLASSSTVHAHLANLEKLGLLRRDPSKPRAIELLDRVREDVGSAVGTAVENALGRAAPRPAARGPGRGRLADPGRGEHRGLRPGAVDRRRRGRRVRPARPRRVDEGRGHPRRRLRRRAPAGHRHRRRDHRRPGGRGGDRQALLPRVRPRPPAARERRHGAHPLQGGPHPRAASSASSGA